MRSYNLIQVTGQCGNIDTFSPFLESIILFQNAGTLELGETTMEKVEIGPVLGAS